MISGGPFQPKPFCVSVRFFFPGNVASLLPRNGVQQVFRSTAVGLSAKVLISDLQYSKTDGTSK